MKKVLPFRGMQPTGSADAADVEWQWKADQIDGFTPEQRFFISHGQGWCRNSSDEAVRLQAQTDPHSPPRYRVNGVVMNLPEFEKAFSCKKGTPMAPEKRCEVW